MKFCEEILKILFENHYWEHVRSRHNEENIFTVCTAQDLSVEYTKNTINSL